MQRKLYKKEERGLKGGPNYQVSEMMGSITSTGYWPDSPDRNNDFNIIPSNEITMEGMDMPLMGMDNLGNTQYMTPGNNYTFPGSYVTETPVAKQGGMFLGHYTFKDGGLVRMQPGGSKERQEKIQKDVNNTAYQATTADWDPHGTNGAQQAPLEKDKKTGKYYTRYYDAASGQYIRQEVKVEVKPKHYVNPKTAPKKTKAQIQAEINDKYQKKAERDPTQFLKDNPGYIMVPGIGAVLREGLDPEQLKKLDMDKAKEDFVKELNTDPLQQSLGTASLDNPVTNQAAENYANYTVNNVDPRWATDKMLSGNDAPSTADFYSPHAATLGFGLPAAMVMAPIVAEGAVAAAPYVAEGFQALKTAAKPAASAFNRSLGKKLLGDPGIFATQGQQLLSNLATPANLLKGWGMYDLTHKYAPTAIEDVNLYNETGDTKYLTDAAYNTGKGLLEGFSHIGPVAQEVQAVKRPVSFIDDARKAAVAEDNASRAIYDFKTVKNAMGLIRKDGGVFLGKFKQVGGQLVPHDISVPNLSRQKGGGIDYEAIKDPELAARAKAMGHNTIADYRNSNWGYGDFGMKNKQQQAVTNTPPVARITQPAEQEKMAYLVDKNKLKLRQQLESAQARFEGGEDIVSALRGSDKAEDALNQMLKKYPDDKRLTAKEMEVSNALGKFMVEQGIEKGVFKGLPLLSSNPKYLDIIESLQGASNIKNVFDIQDVLDSKQRGDDKYAYYTEELKDKVDNYEKAHGIYQPGLIDKVEALIPNKQNGGDMPFGLPLKEQNIYTLPEYNQPRNPKTGEILPDPRRPSLGMDTGATEYKYTYSTDEGDIDIPSVVAGQYIGDQALDRYRLTGERFKTMTDPGSYSNFYDQIGQLGLMQEKHGGSVKKVKIKSLPKNWKSQ
jgi:hypothetical protein